MCFSIKRVKILEYMAAEMIFYYILNLLYIFHYSSWYYCLRKRFQGCQYRNGDEFYCFICWFQLEYNPRDIEKIFDTQKIANIYLSMNKKIFKNVLTSIHQSALSGIIILNSTLGIMKEINDLVIWKIIIFD